MNPRFLRLKPITTAVLSAALLGCAFLPSAALLGGCFIDQDADSGRMHPTGSSTGGLSTNYGLAAGNPGTATYEAESSIVIKTTGVLLSSRDGWNIRANGSIYTSHTFAAGSNAITVRAKGDQFQGAPRMVVSVAGQQIGSVDVPATSWTPYPLSYTAPSAGAREIRVAFTNDLYQSGVGDRNLHVDKFTVQSGTGTGGTTVCATANENQSATLSCPAGSTMASIQFASYGNPTGTCGAYAQGSCHAATSKSVVETACLGKSSCTVPATNATFGDPCFGAGKRLYVQATCGPVAPPTGCPVTENEGPVYAFPGAQGYGRIATGARGRDVYEVTNLYASGPGSLGDALSRSGRTIVFRVSGTITGRFGVPDNTTIAGQTAPGDGIAISGTLGLGNNNIVRYIRVRFNGNDNVDAVGARGRSNIILDHISGSWSRDEVMSLYNNRNVTIQWSMVTEACPNFGTEEHRFGGIWGGDFNTYHHNLIAHNASRNPRWATACGHNDYRNNVLYNWGYQSSYGGELSAPDGSVSGVWINLVANYYKPGPATLSSVRARIAYPSARSSTDKGSWHVSGNYVEGSTSVTNDNWSGVSGSNYIKLTSPWGAMPIAQQTAQAAFLSVLADAGCTRPARDALDARIIQEARNGTATVGKNGLVTCPQDTPLPTLKSTPAPTDSDHDGMPNDFETRCGLNPNDASDRNRLAPDGYTMLEKYLNSIDSF